MEFHTKVAGLALFAVCTVAAAARPRRAAAPEIA